METAIGLLLWMWMTYSVCHEYVITHFLLWMWMTYGVCHAHVNFFVLLFVCALDVDDLLEKTALWIWDKKSKE